MSLIIEGGGWRWRLKCGARDRWIGWDYGVQFARLHLVTNNSRFLILPGGPRNLGSRVHSLCTRRLVRDWPARFGHELLLAETFVNPGFFRGTVYRAANWVEVGRTRGFARDGHGYSEHARPKLVFVHPLCRRAQARLGSSSTVSADIRRLRSNKINGLPDYHSNQA